MSVALEFTHINFSIETLDHRKTVIQTLTNQIRLVLSEGVGIENVWLTLVKYILYNDKTFVISICRKIFLEDYLLKRNLNKFRHMN